MTEHRGWNDQPMRQRLLERYRALLSEFVSTDEELRLIEETVRPDEPEAEEHGQEEALARVLARLEDHQQRELRDIQDALGRIYGGSYGRCARCGRRISRARLDALPEARYCLECSRAVEAEASGVARPEGVGSERVGGTPLPPGLSGASDAEIEEAVFEELREGGGDAFRDVRAESGNGQVRLSGEVPSDEHRDLAVEAVAGALACPKGECPEDDEESPE